MKLRVFIFLALMLFPCVCSFAGPYMGKTFHAINLSVAPSGHRSAWNDGKFSKDLFEGNSYTFEPSFGVSASYLSKQYGFAWGCEMNYEKAKFDHYVHGTKDSMNETMQYDGIIDELSGASVAFLIGHIFRHGHRFQFPLLFSMGGEYAFGGDTVHTVDVFLGIKFRIVGYVSNKVALWAGQNASIGFGGIMTTRRYLDFGVTVEL